MNSKGKLKLVTPTTTTDEEVIDEINTEEESEFDIVALLQRAADGIGKSHCQSDIAIDYIDPKYSLELIYYSTKKLLRFNIYITRASKVVYDISR